MFDTPLFGITITLLFYYFAQEAAKHKPHIHPLLLTVGGIILFLLITGIPYEAYAKGGEMLSFLLGPATVALAVPIYKHFSSIRKHFLSILAAITLGHVVGLLSVFFILFLMNGSREVMLSMLPKSVTTPISVELSRWLGGIPELAGLFTVLAGLIGSMVGPVILRRCGIMEDLAIGTAMGTAAHGIGTARLLQENEMQGSVGGFAMGVSGIILPLLIAGIFFLRLILKF
ncbi:MAG: LrgB family protein [Thermicanus sp.]|nr:LrgB family protein [Thermicanus sp.]